jgi:peroxiredoxin family protein
VKRVAVIVSRGEFNNLVQVATLLMAAVCSGVAVRVFFRDEAVYGITHAGAGEPHFSPGYRGQEGVVRERLAAQGLGDLRNLFREVKAAGDARLYACTASMAICGVERDQLVPEIDGVRGLTAFLLDDMAEAQHVLTF